MLGVLGCKRVRCAQLHVGAMATLRQNLEALALTAPSLGAEKEVFLRHSTCGLYPHFEHAVGPHCKQADLNWIRNPPSCELIAANAPSTPACSAGWLAH